MSSSIKMIRSSYAAGSSSRTSEEDITARLLPDQSQSEMADGKNEATVSVGSVSDTTPTRNSNGIAKFLRKLRGQIDSDDTAFAVNLASSETSSEVYSLDEDGKAVPSHENGLQRYYMPIEAYEGRHRYDPKAKWTEDEEKKLVRRLDLKICAWACFMFFALQLDRGNITQALSDNMLNDLGLSTNDFNTGQTIFFVSFLLAELPSQLVSKKLGPDNWIPIQMICWSIVACSQSKINSRGTFFLTRSLMGLIEGGFIPDVILYLSYFYTSKELPIRLSFFWASYSFTFIISAFLAYGILHLRGVHGMAGWQWLFALEGALTACIGIVSYFYLPPSPTQTASYFRGKNGWFTPREETIMVTRIIRDDPSKGDMHNRQALSWSLLWEALKDYDMWPIYLLGLTWLIPQQPSAAYLTLILKGLGFNTFNTNLLTIPAYVLFICQALFWAWISEKYNNRYATVLIAQLWCLPLVIALEILPGSAAYVWPRYVLNLLLVGVPYAHPIVVAMTSRNAGSVRTRTVGSALYNMSVQMSNIISSNIYRTEDAPYYRTGNKVLIGITIWNIVLIIASKSYYIWRNNTRDRKWKAMSEAEREAYLSQYTSSDANGVTTGVASGGKGGNKRLDFRFVH